VKRFTSGRSARNHRTDEAQYELATAHRAAGDPQRALDTYRGRHRGKAAVCRGIVRSREEGAESWRQKEKRKDRLRLTRECNKRIVTKNPEYEIKGCRTRAEKAIRSLQKR